MKVFISWSGEKSKQVAILFERWIRCVLQAVTPLASFNDIEHGSIWFNELSEQLLAVNTGIVFVTRKNSDSRWILFETGALLRGLSKSRVCIFLIDLSPTEIHPPLSKFNCTLPYKESVFGLVKTLNNGLPEPLRDDILETSFNTYWPKFETDFTEILNVTDHTEDSKAKINKEDKIDETLTLVRLLNNRITELQNYTRSKQKNVLKRDLIINSNITTEVYVIECVVHFGSKNNYSKELSEEIKGFSGIISLYFMPMTPTMWKLKLAFSTSAQRSGFFEWINKKPGTSVGNVIMNRLSSIDDKSFFST
jgi:hypothetical protein